MSISSVSARNEVEAEAIVNRLRHEIRNPHKYEPMSTSTLVGCLGVCALAVAMQGVRGLENMHANDPDEGKKQRIHEFAGHAILGLSAVAISPLLATACGSVALSAILAGVTIAAAAYTFKQVYQIRQENIGNPAIKRAVTFSYISVTAVTVLSLTGCYLAASNRSQ